jgi:hypothetical protein
MHFELSSADVTSGTAVGLSTGMSLAHDYMDIPYKLRHMGDTDTYLQFDGNRIRIYAGGTLVIDSNNTYLTSSGILDQDDMSSNSATAVASQQSIKAYVDAEVAGIVNSAPAALNTLDELAAALGDDANFATTTSTSLGNRLRVDTSSQGLTGTQQANAITNLGITATKAELNYVDGVTSAIQTQLNGKLSTSGTAANSTLLNNLGAGSFLRSDANDTWSGNISTTSTNGIRFGNANQTDGNDGFIAAARFASGLNIVGTQTTAGTGRQVRIYGDLIDSAGVAYIKTDSSLNGSNISSGTVAAARIANLAASKITSGTFADARIAASSITQHTDSKYLRSDTGDTAAGNITFTGKLLGDTSTTSILNGVNVSNLNTAFSNDISTSKASGLQPFRYSNSSTNTPLGGSGSMANNANWGLSLYSHGTGGGGNYGLQMSGGDNDNQLFFIRRVTNGSFGSWFEMWHSGNDGSGSGLDADTLDGVQGSAFLRSNADDSVTGIITFEEAVNMNATDNTERLYFKNNGTTVGDIGTNDTTWLRINQSTAKNIYTPRYIRADNGFFVDGATLGIDGTGNVKVNSTVDSNTSNLTLRRAASDNDRIVIEADQHSFYVNGTKRLEVKGNGTVQVNGTLNATADVVAYFSSDKRLKDNLKPIENSLDKVSKLSGYEFDWNDKQETYKGHDIGVVAQEVEEVLPELVATREDGYKAVKYEKIVALLIESIKELKAEVEELKK